jgi:ATP-binding cassette, subfamily A (ABC1), member 3
MMIPLFDQVLPKENGMRYPWNFMFQACFWRKKSTKDISCKVPNLDNSDEKTSLVGKDVLKQAVEGISLEMKQQELDGRYMC